MEDDQSEANKQSKETQDLAAHKKHTEMLQRLSNMHHSRLQQTAARRSAADSSYPSFETVQSFLSRFSDSKISVEADLQRCRALAASDPDAKPQIKAELDKVSASISDLERLVAETSYFLPPYEVRSSLKTIAGLKEILDKANADILPRKKFSFKSKASSNRDHPSPLVKEFDDLVGVNTAPQSKIVVTASPGFRNKQGEILVKTFSPEERDGEFSLNDLDSCDVYLKGRFRALFIHRLNNCHIFAGPVLGSILIEKVNGCSFMLASHQIRIHEAEESDFYLRVRSKPIVEDCKGVRFAPYRMFYEGIEKDLRDSDLEEETGNWAHVHDFRWLRAVQSPNWCVIPDEELVALRDVSDVKGKSFDQD